MCATCSGGMCPGEPNTSCPATLAGAQRIMTLWLRDQGLADFLFLYHAAQGCPGDEVCLGLIVGGS